MMDHPVFTCQERLTEQGFREYILVKEHRFYRKIDGLTTYFARILYKNMHWTIEYGVYPTLRHEVYIEHNKNVNNYAIVNYLKNHDSCILYFGGIVEPYIFPLTRLDGTILKQWQVYSFQDPIFAVEFKLLWG